MLGFVSKRPMNYHGLTGKSVLRAAGVLIGRVSRQNWFRVRMLGELRTGLGRYIMFSVQIYLDLDGSESEQRYSKRYVST